MPTKGCVDSYRQRPCPCPCRLQEVYPPLGHVDDIDVETVADPAAPKEARTASGIIRRRSNSGDRLTSSEL